MTIYVSGRQSGKTTFLIRQSADTGAVIVAPTCQMARYIDSMARDLGLQIPPPVTVADWIRGLVRQPKDHDKTYLVDELQMALHQLNVKAATIDRNYEEMVRMFGVKETCCTRCSHRDVCQYKSEYLAAQTAVDEVSVRRPSKDDESISSIRLHDIPWIEPVELKCTYFRQDTGDNSITTIREENLMLEKTLIDLAHRHFEIMWRYEAMTNSIIVRMEKRYKQQWYKQNYRVTFGEIGCSGGFEVFMTMLLKHLADETDRMIKTNCNSD